MGQEIPFLGNNWENLFGNISNWELFGVFTNLGKIMEIIRL
jgi:hypothetical protein